MRRFLHSALGIILIAPGVLTAQIAPPPGPPPKYNPWLPWGVAVAVFFVVGFGAMKSSKRGHQD